ncbi:hypothetical protein E4U17_007419, partial [Claviceps sp. LM77 group G4]
HKEKMWQVIAEQINVPWTEAEQNHWHLGKPEMDKRAADADFRESWQKTYVASETDDDSHPAPPPVDDAEVSALDAQETQGRIQNWPWSGAEETSLLNHRAANKTYNEISSLWSGRTRTAWSCRMYHEIIHDRAGGWSPELQTDLSRLYEKHKSEMWAEFEIQLGEAWESAEAMHWIMGSVEIRKRAGYVQTVEPDQPAANQHELQPTALTDCEPFDNRWETLILNRDP